MRGREYIGRRCAVRQFLEIDDGGLADDDVILRYDGDHLIGFTILHASHRP